MFSYLTIHLMEDKEFVASQRFQEQEKEEGDKEGEEEEEDFALPPMDGIVSTHTNDPLNFHRSKDCITGCQG